jgi:hypothetical protein
VTSKDDVDKHPFIDQIIAKKQVTPDAWKNQCLFDHDCMAFLTLMSKEQPGIYGYFNSQCDVSFDANEQLGLLCASGECSNLDICYVPQLVDWDISSYDGQETIHIL